MSGLVILVGSFLTGARLLTSPNWISPFLTISAVAIVPLFLALLFLLQTRFRPQLQEDAYYAAYLESQRKEFQNFEPENLVSDGSGRALLASQGEIDTERIARYTQYQGVFLVHSWRPSSQAGQVADIALRLQQHGEGPLSRGTIDHVEYALGPKFFSMPVVKKNKTEFFRLEISAYGPVLCLARVHLSDGSDFLLERYLDFPDAWESILTFRGVSKNYTLPPGVVKPD